MSFNPITQSFFFLFDMTFTPSFPSPPPHHPRYVNKDEDGAKGSYYFFIYTLIKSILAKGLLKYVKKKILLVARPYLT